MVPVGGRACILCRRHKKRCVVDGSAINRRLRTKKDTVVSREGSQKRRSRESPEEPDGRSQKRRRLNQRPMIIESDDESVDPRTEGLAQKAATEWTVGLLGQRVEKVERQLEKMERQITTVHDVFVQLLERDLVWRPRSQVERSRSAGQEAEHRTDVCVLKQE